MHARAPHVHARAPHHPCVHVRCPCTHTHTQQMAWCTWTFVSYGVLLMATAVRAAALAGVHSTPAALVCADANGGPIRCRVPSTSRYPEATQWTAQFQFATPAAGTPEASLTAHCCPDYETTDGTNVQHALVTRLPQLHSLPGNDGQWDRECASDADCEHRGPGMACEFDTTTISRHRMACIIDSEAWQPPHKISTGSYVPPEDCSLADTCQQGLTCTKHPPQFCVRRHKLLNESCTQTTECFRPPDPGPLGSVDMECIQGMCQVVPWACGDPAAPAAGAAPYACEASPRYNGDQATAPVVAPTQAGATVVVVGTPPSPALDVAGASCACSLWDHWNPWTSLKGLWHSIALRTFHPMLYAGEHRCANFASCNGETCRVTRRHAPGGVCLTEYLGR